MLKCIKISIHKMIYVIIVSVRVSVSLTKDMFSNVNLAWWIIEENFASAIYHSKISRMNISSREKFDAPEFAV